MELHKIFGRPRRQAGEALRAHRETGRNCRGYRSTAVAGCLLASLSFGLTGCSDDAPAPKPVEQAELAPVVSNPPLETAIAGEHRSAKNAARDVHRHPLETLTGFGVKPTDTVVELWPGGGWYTEILAPYLRDNGKLIAASFDPNAGVKFQTKMDAAYREKLGSNPAVYDKVEIVPFGKPYAGLPLEEGSVDVVLTFRSSHNWMRDGAMEAVYQAAFKALKPGGTFGVVQHRGRPDQPPLWARKFGYMPQAHVVSVAESVGFKLEDSFEINANPKDRKDYSAGVWTLPPSYRLGDENREEYEAIGESDRMTLKFVKPSN